MSKNRVQAVERSIDLLFALADSPRTLADVVDRTGLKKATAFRLLATLGYGGLVVKTGTEGRYMLGPGCLQLFQGVIAETGVFSSVGQGELRDVWQQTNETIVIHSRVGLERICIEELASPEPVRYVATVGAVEPLHVGSAGKVLLAFTEPAQQEKILARLPLQAITARTITDPARLRRELRLVEKRGWAMSEGERVVGAAALSVPIIGPTGLLASLSVLGPAGRLSRARRLEILPLLLDASAAIARALEPTAREEPTKELAA